MSFLTFGRLTGVRVLGVVILLAAAGPVVAQPNLNRSRQFPPGALKRIEDLPIGRVRTRMERLNPAARQRALDSLQHFHFTEMDLDSLQVDDDGGVYYADVFTLEPVPAEAESPVVAETAVPVTPFPTSLIFHSRPGAPNILYLNFSGEDVTGTAWNSSLSRTVIPAVAFSSDADFSTFSDSEQTVIKRVWERVAEDYAPFNIDVTTERPATFTSRTADALITRNTDANGDANPSSTAGGVAYVNVFAGGGYASSRPAWIYYNNLSSSESYIAEAVSHEIGHNMGLSHDAKTDGTSYYGGHGSGDTSWGPIMGTGYNRNVSQWCKGEYYLANNTEDDLAIISGKLTYRVDDHGDTRATATPLVVTGVTNVVSTTPETDPTNAHPDNKGVLEQNTDVDVFSFVTGSGQVSLRVNPWIMPSGTRGGNLDVLLELYNENGVLLLTNNPASTTYASIVTNLSEGLYFLYVRNTGVGDPFSSTPTGYTSYGSIGQYFISGYLQPSGYVAPPQADLQVTDISQAGVGANQFTVTYTDNLAVDVATLDSNDVRVTGPHGYDHTAQFISIDSPSDGTPRVVTYSVEPPVGNTWSNSDNGTYHLELQSNEVSDTEGVFADAQQLGSFNVTVPVLVYADYLDANTGWTFEAQWQYGPPNYAANANGPSSGFTGTKVIGYNLVGNYANNLATAYATSPLINCSGVSSLTLQFRRWLRLKGSDTALIQISTNGSDWTDIWSTTRSVTDSSWQLMQYSLPDWVAGSPSVQLRWGIGSGSSSTDIGWNLDDIQISGVGSIIPINYMLTASANNPAWGTVSPTNGIYPVGTAVQIAASPTTYYRFVNWTGDTSGTNNPLTIALTTNLSVQAVFSEILTTNHPTPFLWLASVGYTQNLESAVSGLGDNGFPLWQSYIAGLDPSDPSSQLRLSLQPVGGGNLALQWETVPGRVYSLWSSSNLLTGFTPVTNATDLPASITSFTNDLGTAATQTFFRLEVKKP